MLKLIVILAVIYSVLQFGLGIDVNKKLEPLVDTLVSKANDELPELGEQLLEKLSAEDLTGLLQSQDFDLGQMTDLLENNNISLDDVNELLEQQNISGDAAKEKLEQLKELLQEKMEEGN